MISLVSGVYNVADFLPRTIDSLLAQTHQDFECIFVNDGSTDNSLEVLKSYAAKDKRIRFIDLEKNGGVAHALNTAIKEVRGEYIGIVDSDDIYLPQRLEKQAAFLDSHSDHIIIGASGILIDEEDKIIGREEIPESDAAIRWRLPFNSPFMHPCVMMRASAFHKLENGYNETFKAASDYDLWSRLLKLGKAYNFKEPLMLYRFRSTAISSTLVPTQLKNRDIVVRRVFSEMFGDHGLSDEEINRLRFIFHNRPRIFDTDETRPLQKPTEKEVDTYFDLLKQHSDSLPDQEAFLFLTEEMNFLSKEYLERIGVNPNRFVKLATARLG